MRLEEESLMLMDILDFLEPLIQGRWEYLGGLFLGSLMLFLVRSVYKLITEREKAKDQSFAQTHLSVPIKTLEKNHWMVLLSIVILLFIVLPVSLWITVEVLKSIKDIDPGIALLFVLINFIIITIILIVQVVRFKRMGRRIKLIKQTNPV
jgi:riboflavin transporter FmnP